MTAFSRVFVITSISLHGNQGILLCCFSFYKHFGLVVVQLLLYIFYPSCSELVCFSLRTYLCLVYNTSSLLQMTLHFIDVTSNLSFQQEV